MNKLSSRHALSFLAITSLMAAALVVGCGRADSASPRESTAEAVSPAPDVKPGSYAIDRSHSEVGFRVKHLGLSTVRGLFNDVDGVIIFTGEELSGMQAHATIRAASIYTNEADRDDHLRSGDFFDAENHPEIIFTSREVTSSDGTHFALAGDLAIRGVTRPIVLEGEYLGTAVDPWGNERIALAAEGTINRTEFGLNWNQALEAGGFLVGDDVTVVLDVQALKQDG